jgi:GNAT superfamily N-acetyltransferase
LAVRAARSTDVPAMHAIRLAVRENRLGSPDRVTEDDYRARLLRGDGAWVAERDGEIVGVAMVDPPSRSVWALFVAPQAEGSGIGRALQATMLDAVLEAWPRVALSTSPGTRAESFYLASGWDAAGTLANGERVFGMTRERWRARRR